MYNEGNNNDRVTIDTNLVVNGTIAPQSVPSRLLTSWATGSFTWVHTQNTFNEIKEVLYQDKIRLKYHLDEQDLTNFLDNLAVGAEFVTLLRYEDLPLHVRDTKDDILLECAFGGNYDYLVTGDKDLLALKGRAELGELKIVNVGEFLRRKRKQ